jgi:hypothetical protein
MKKTIVTAIAALGIGFTSASTLALADCYFDGETPADGSTLQKNPKVSLGGDECTVFQLYVKKLDDEGNEIYELIPRAMGVFDWQQCRFSNVMTDLKIGEHLSGNANAEGEVIIVGECGYIKPPEEDDGPAPDPDGMFVGISAVERVFKVE